MEELDLPEPIKVKKNIKKQLDDLEQKGKNIYPFDGVPFIQVLIYLYLIKKYKSKCIIHTKEEYFFNRHIGIGFPAKVTLDKTDKLELMEQFKEVAQIVAKCINNGENTVIIPLTYSRGRGGHANMLIYKKNLNIIEHFEPHGSQYIDNPRLQQFITNYMLEFVKLLNLELHKFKIQPTTYVEASNVCPYIEGLQLIEGKSKLPSNKFESPGYCLAWSFFFTELCLKNLELSSKDVLENIYNYLTTKPNTSNYLKQVIRGYSGYIAEIIDKYLEIFFKPKISITELINSYKQFSPRNTTINQTVQIISELELKIMYDPEFNLKKELSKVKKEYKKQTKLLTKNGTKEEQRIAQFDYRNPEYRNLYLLKRVLQNYEEYNNTGRVSDPIFDSSEVISADKIVNLNVKTRKQKSSSTVKSHSKTKKTLIVDDE